MFKIIRNILSLTLPTDLYARGVVKENELYFDFYGPKRDRYQGIWTPGYFLLVDNHEKVLRKFSEPQEESEREKFYLFVSELNTELFSQALVEIKKELEKKLKNQIVDLTQSQDNLVDIKKIVSNLVVA